MQEIYKYDKIRGRKNAAKNVVLPYSFDLRCVRVILPDGTAEILITNLPKNQFKTKDIDKLYAMRWGIETGFGHLKTAVHIEDFVGIKENSIKQEFYAALIKYNIVMLFIREAETVHRDLKKNSKIGLQSEF